MLVLSQFLLRLACGLSFGMAVTNSQEVSSGFFKVHLWVVMGLCTLALLVAVATPGFVVWPPLVAAVISYLGSVLWIYEARRLGQIALWATAAITLAGGWLLPLAASEGSATAGFLIAADVPLSGVFLGLTCTAMFLGHWYLNTPTMKLAPLRRLLVLMAIATLLRACSAGAGAAVVATSTDTFSAAGAGTTLLLLSLRWLWGIVGVGLLTWMAWQTLKIPNTQSATGILYVAVIAAFLGELSAQLLSARVNLPV